jgi:TPR repeat protein
MKLTTAAAAIAAVVIIAHAAPAFAVDRACPKGQAWDIKRGSCRKLSGKGGPAKKYQEGLAHLEGRAKNPDTAKGLKLIGEACTKKVAEACTQLGFVYLNGRGDITKDSQKAADFYLKACDLKDADGCVGEFEAHAYGYLGTSDYAKGLPYLKKACNTLKNGRACRRLAQVYAWGGVGVEVDTVQSDKLYKLAFPMLEKDCDDDDGLSCSELGTMYRDGYGAPFDLAKSVKLFQKGCDKGAGAACYSLAQLYDPDSYYSYVQGREALIDRTYAKPYALYEKACTRYDNFDSCYTAGRWLSEGKVKGDLASVEKMAKRVCDLSAYSCILWASLKDEGKLVTQDRAGALELYVKACDASNSAACTTAADKYWQGQGVAYSITQALGLWEKACELWDAVSCTRAAQWYWYGDTYSGVPQDLAKAFTLFQSGCNRGDMDSCLWTGDLLTNGTDGTNVKKPKLAVDYYVYACNYGNGRACWLVGDLYATGAATDTKDPVSAASYYQQACFAYGSFEAQGCLKTVEVLRAGIDVPKDLITAGRAQAVICKNYGAVADCLLADQLLKEGGADQWVKEDVVYQIDSACTSGVENACVALALLYRGGGFMVAKNVTESTTRLQASCDRFFMEACYRLGESYERGLGVSADAGQARLYFQKACDGYVPDACVAIARVAGDPKEAVELFKRLCDQSVPAGCSGAAAAYASGGGVRWDVGTAFDLYTKGCDLNDAPSCAKVAEMLEVGIAKDVDLKKAYELYQKSCDAGYVGACGAAARFLEKGDGGVAVDVAKADKLYEQACEADAPDACRWYADFLKASKKGSSPKIAQLYGRALSLAKEQAKSSAYHQWLLGTFHLDGVATVKNPDAAVKLFVEACDANYPMGCLDAGRMYLGEPGYEGVPPDLAVAAVTLDKACSANVVIACTLADKARTGPTPGPVKKTAKGCCDSGGGAGAAIPGVLVMLALIGSRRRRRGLQRASDKSS